ncbi:unnamed protein product [Taenia asiatica]|uniref:MFS_1_like domain-containing protein n=1 Tax=Taenia asiatica TaxID=60517 RepID=A0A158R995_TAEAS|nr:unnamed protein product [Taenia asiatica]
MSRWSCDSTQGDEEWDILSVSSIDDLLNKSLDDPESTAHSFVLLSTPLWAPRRCVSVPSNLNYVYTSVSDSNGVSPSIPVDYPIPSESKHDCDSGRTTPGDLSDNTTLSSSSHHDCQEGSGYTSPDELSEISSTSSSECDPYEESVKRRSSMHGKASTKKTLPLPEIIGAAVKTTTPVSVRDVIRTLTDPTIIMRVNPQERVSYIHCCQALAHSPYALGLPIYLCGKDICCGTLSTDYLIPRFDTIQGTHLETSSHENVRNDQQVQTLFSSQQNTFAADMRHGYCALLGGFLIMLALGQMYTLANTALYIVSFLHEYVEGNISTGFAVWLSAGAVVAFGISLPLSGIFWRKVGLMRFVFVACLLNSMFEDVKVLDRIPLCLQITGALLTGLQVVGCCFFRQRPSSDLEIDEGETVAQTPIPDDQFLMVVCITGAIFNVLGRFFWGYVGDKLSFKIPMVLVNAVYAAALVSLSRILWLPGAGRVCYAIWVPLLFLCLAGNSVMLTFGIARSMGSKHVASIYGTVFLASVPASLIGAGIFSQIDVEKHFNELFLANGIIALCVSIIAVFLQDDRIPRWPKWLPCNLNRAKSPLFSDTTVPAEIQM